MPGKSFIANYMPSVSSCDKHLMFIGSVLKCVSFVICHGKANSSIIVTQVNYVIGTEL